MSGSRGCHRQRTSRSSHHHHHLTTHLNVPLMSSLSRSQALTFTPPTTTRYYRGILAAWVPSLPLPFAPFESLARSESSATSAASPTPTPTHPRPKANEGHGPNTTRMLHVWT